MASSRSSECQAQLIKICTVSQGSVNESLAHPREVFKPLITHSAYSFILVHNHPSGDPSPSDADMRLTRRIRVGAAISVLRKPASFRDAFKVTAQPSLARRTRRTQRKMS